MGDAPAIEDMQRMNGDPLRNIEAALLSIEGLAEAVYELSEPGDGAARRKLSAIGAVSGHLLDEVRQAREQVQKVFEYRAK